MSVQVCNGGAPAARAALAMQVPPRASPRMQMRRTAIASALYNPCSSRHERAQRLIQRIGKLIARDAADQAHLRRNGAI